MGSVQRNIVWITCGVLAVCVANSASADQFRLTPGDNLDSLLKQVKAGDVVILAAGIWNEPELSFENLEGVAGKPIRIRAETPGRVVLTGKAEFRLSGTHVIVSGLRFENCDGVSDVFDLRTHSARHAHHCRVTDCSFEQTHGLRGGRESRWLNVYGTGNRVDHCYFSGKQNRGATLVVWVDETIGAHRIDHNHFGPRPELGRNGGETIRVGTSQVSEFNSRTIVEENYFERCNGGAEIISNKSCENVYRFNLFERCSGALTLRHGHRCTVEGNVFLGHAEKGTGGVRIIGRGHRVTNNYFEALRGNAERAAICLMNGIPDSPLSGYAPVREALIAHNTFLDCKVSMEFGVASSPKVSVAPADCRVSHNVFVPGKWELFRIEEKPERFTWTDNRYQAGKTRGAELVDIKRVDIKLTRAADGLLRPTDATSLVASGVSGVMTDIDGQNRQTSIAGCDDPGTTVSDRKLRTTSGPTWR